MIPNHEQFLQAVRDKKKVWVKYFSKADNAVVERTCAPMDYGPGVGTSDGLHRYILWNYSNHDGENTLSLLPKQIVSLDVLGEVFDPSTLVADTLAADMANDVTHQTISFDLPNYDAVRNI
jgi:hypothetical protein